MYFVGFKVSKSGLFALFQGKINSKLFRIMFYCWMQTVEMCIIWIIFRGKFSRKDDGILQDNCCIVVCQPSKSGLFQLLLEAKNERNVGVKLVP